MKIKLMQFLLTLVFPKIEGIVDGDDLPPGDDGDDLPPGDEGDDLPPGDEGDDLPPGDEPEPKPRTRAEARIQELSRRAKEAEAAAERLRIQAEERERLYREQMDQANRSPQRDEVWEQEEAILRNPNASDWERYAVTSAREARMARQEVAIARREAHDMADKANFDRLAVTKPKLYEKYSGQVEKTLAEMRKQGHNAPREQLMALLVGKDMLEGKLTSAEAGKPRKPTGPKPPGVRSDVPRGTSQATGVEAARKRLEGVSI